MEPEQVKGKRRNIRKATMNAMLMDYGKLPPQAVDLEEEVLGILLNYSNKIDTIIEFFKPEIFYKESHQIICRIMRTLIDKNIRISTNSVCTFLNNTGELDMVGGRYAINQLEWKFMNPFNLKWNILIIFQQYLKREVIRICHDGKEEAFEIGTDPFDIIKDLQDQMDKLDIFRELRKTKAMETALKKTYNDIFLRAEGNIKTYYKIRSALWDRYIAISPGNILLIGGAAGSGKTRLSAWLIRRLLTHHQDIHVLWYAMEDPEDKLIRCFISMDTGLTDSQILGKNYKLSMDELNSIIQVRNEIEGYKIVFGNGSQTIDDIHQDFLSFCKRNNSSMNILIIDNIMKLKDHRMMKNQIQADEHIAARMQDIMTDSMPYNSLVIVLHHFTKEQVQAANMKEGYRPMRDHLRGSSRYMDAATQVIFLNKPGIFDDLIKDMPAYAEVLKYLMIAEVIKNRNDELGLIRMWADLRYNRFKEIDLIV